MPLGQINQVGQGEVSPGRRRSYDQSLSRSFAASGAIGYTGNFQAGSIGQISRNPLFSAQRVNYYGRASNDTLSWMSGHISQIMSYTPFPDGIAGLHPGSGGAALSIIRGMTPFGSPIRLDKAVDSSLYQSLWADRHRAQVKSFLSAVDDPRANIIGFDIETTGTKSALEFYSGPGGTYAKPTEYAISSTSRYKSSGFTRYAKPGILKRLSQSQDYGVEFGEALGRLQRYRGPKVKAIDIVNQIADAIIPGKKNIIAGHNLSGFDMKIISAQYALEKGYVNRQQIKDFRAAATNWSSQGRVNAQEAITAGWERASQEIMSTFRKKDANVQFLDTLGRFKTGTFVTPVDTEEGLIQSIMRGYFPGLENVHVDAGLQAGLSSQKAVEQAQYASAKGTSLSSFMKFIGMKFEGQAHDPVADVQADMDFINSKRLREYVGQMEGYIASGNKEALHAEMVRFLEFQKAEQAEVLRKGVGGPQKIALAKHMAGLEFEKDLPKGRFANFISEIGAGFNKQPMSTRIALGAGALTIGALAISNIFNRDRTIHADDGYYNTITGIHPGNRGYATQIVRGMTDFGSGYRGLINIPSIIGSYLPADMSGAGGFVIGNPVVCSTHRDIQSGERSLKNILDEDIAVSTNKIRSMVNGMETMSEGAEPAYRKALDKFKADIADAEKAGFKPSEMVFMNQKTIEQFAKDRGGSKLQIMKDLLRHERQHTYSNVTGGLLTKEIASTPSLVTHATHFLQERYGYQAMSMSLFGIDSKYLYSEEFAAHLAGIRTRRPEQRAAHIRRYYSPMSEKMTFGQVTKKILDQAGPKEKKEILKTLSNRREKIDAYLDYRSQREHWNVMSDNISRISSSSVGDKITKERAEARSIYRKSNRTMFGANKEFMAQRNQARFGPSLKAKPTAGLVSVLESVARGAKKFMSKLPIR